MKRDQFDDALFRSITRKAETMTRDEFNDLIHSITSTNRGIARGFVSESALTRRGHVLDVEDWAQEQEPTPAEIEIAAEQLLAREQNDEAETEAIYEAIDRGEVSMAALVAAGFKTEKEK